MSLLLFYCSCWTVFHQHLKQTFYPFILETDSQFQFHHMYYHHFMVSFSKALSEIQPSVSLCFFVCLPSSSVNPTTLTEISDSECQQLPMSQIQESGFLSHQDLILGLAKQRTAVLQPTLIPFSALTNIVCEV